MHIRLSHLYFDLILCFTETDHGSWESNFPNEAKVLLFKALHNTLERYVENYQRATLNQLIDKRLLCVLFIANDYHFSDTCCQEITYVLANGS